MNPYVRAAQKFPAVRAQALERKDARRNPPGNGDSKSQKPVTADNP